MKTLLIVLNILLAGAVVWGSVGFIKKLSPGGAKTTFTVKKRVPKTARLSSTVKRDIRLKKSHPAHPGKVWSNRSWKRISSIRTAVRTEASGERAMPELK